MSFQGFNKKTQDEKMITSCVIACKIFYLRSVIQTFLVFFL